MVEGIVSRIAKGVVVTVSVHLISKGIMKCVDVATDLEKQAKMINDFNNFKTKLRNKKWSKSKET